MQKGTVAVFANWADGEIADHDAGCADMGFRLGVNGVWFRVDGLALASGV
jgi:hypothetical protein